MFVTTSLAIQFDLIPTKYHQNFVVDLNFFLNGLHKLFVQEESQYLHTSSNKQNQSK